MIFLALFLRVRILSGPNPNLEIGKSLQTNFNVNDINVWSIFNLEDGPIRSKLRTRRSNSISSIYFFKVYVFLMEKNKTGELLGTPWGQHHGEARRLVVAARKGQPPPIKWKRKLWSMNIPGPPPVLRGAPTRSRDTTDHMIVRLRLTQRSSETWP